MIETVKKEFSIQEESVEELQSKVEALRNRLAEEQKLREELVSTTSHDLRSPIGAINIFCEILMSGPQPLDESQRQNVRMIAEASDKLQRILHDTVDIARLYANRPAQFAILDFRSCAIGALEQLQSAVEHKQLSVRRNFTAEASQVAGEEEKVTQVLVRLLSDLIRKAKPESEIEISDETSRGNYILSASVTQDSREAGLPRELHRFFPKGRLGIRKPGESRYTQATSEKVVELMGGKIQFQSDGEYSIHISVPLPA